LVYDKVVGGIVPPPLSPLYKYQAAYLMFVKVFETPSLKNRGCCFLFFCFEGFEEKQTNVCILADEIVVKRGNCAFLATTVLPIQYIQVKPVSKVV